MIAGTPPIFAQIVARARNGVIGRDGNLPWRLSTDLKHFKATTVGKPVLMGRKTWDSVAGMLSKRPNLVLSRQVDFTAPGAESFTDLQAMLARGQALARELGVDEVMIIGGAQIYAATLAQTRRVYVTDVDADVEGDAVYPDLPAGEWTQRSAQAYPAGPRDDHAFMVRVLERG